MTLTFAALLFFRAGRERKNYENFWNTFAMKCHRYGMIIFREPKFIGMALESCIHFIFDIYHLPTFFTTTQIIHRTANVHERFPPTATPLTFQELVHNTENWMMCIPYREDETIRDDNSHINNNKEAKE